MNLPLPPDGGLRPQVRHPEDCLSAYRVMGEHFMPDIWEQTAKQVIAEFPKILKRLGE